jgi:hypothetical protein
MFRSSAEMMPFVTVGPPSPSGNPIATTSSPNRSDEDFPRSIDLRSSASTSMTARSFSGVVPMTVPSIVPWSSLNTTLTSVDPATT